MFKFLSIIKDRYVNYVENFPTIMRDELPRPTLKSLVTIFTLNDVGKPFRLVKTLSNLVCTVHSVVRV